MHTQHGTVARRPLSALLLAAGAAAFGLLAAPAHAQFLVNPTGGTNIVPAFVDPGNPDPLDDGYAQRPLGGTFTFYGNNITSIYAQVNGFLSSIMDGADVSSDQPVSKLAMTVGSPVIAPFYDDFFVQPGDTVLEKIGAGSYYSLTYDIEAFSSASRAQADKFQTVLFTGNTTINGVAFKAGDIVFSYGALNAPVQTGNFSVGIAQSMAVGTSAFGGTSQFTSTGAFTSNFNPATQGLLFRPTTTGGVTTYTQTLTPLAAAPEPSQYAAFGLGILGLGAMTLKARRRGVTA